MINILFSKLVGVVELVYERVYHEQVSPEVKQFFKNISYVGFGTIIATIFSFTFNILSGRVLGPSMYGEFALIESIAMFLYIPMLMGFHASMVKYNAEKKDYKRQQTIISTTYILVFIFILISIFLYTVFSSQIIVILSIPTELYYIAIAFAILFVLYTLSTETLRSLHELKKYSIFKPIFSFILLASFLLFISIDFISSKSMIFSMYLAYGIISVAILYSIRKYLICKFDKAWAYQLMKYSFYSLMGGVSSVLYSNIDKILINKYMQIMDVGVYRAYTYSFVAIILVMIFVFTTVFFPYASMCNNKEILLRRINKIIPYLILIGLPFMMICGYIILKVYGDEYTFDIKLAFLFGLVGICISVDKLYGQLMNSIGVKGIKVVSFAAIIMALTNILLNIWLIPMIGIEGAVIATIISYLISITIMLSKRKYIYDFEGNNVEN